MDGVCGCGGAVFTRGLCRACYGRRWRKKNPEKVRFYNSQRDWSAWSKDDDFDVLDTLRVATGLSSLEIARYIRALREGVA